MKSGEIYRGLLVSAEESMNMSLSDVLRTARNGQITKLTNVYLRGSSVRFIALPELLKNAPVFQKVKMMKRKMEAAQSAALSKKKAGSGGGKARSGQQVFFEGISTTQTLIKHSCMLCVVMVLSCYRHKEKTR